MLLFFDRQRRRVIEEIYRTLPLMLSCNLFYAPTGAEQSMGSIACGCRQSPRNWRDLGVT